MCGFIGVFFNNDSLRESDQVAIRQAGKKLSHRGPDDQGEYFDDRAGIFFNRLSILDTSSAGHQPMVSSDERYVLVLNGEIYNFKELKADLEKEGHVFKTRTDTEVLLKMFEAKGPECVKDLRGMFSFIVWDKKNKVFSASRDRLGIKPLYIYQDARCIVFASEIKAILDFVPRARRWDEKTIFKYISRGWLDDTNDTFFAEIKSVPCAHQVSVANGKVHMKRYWTLESADNKPYNEEEFRSVFSETVSLHLRSDVPLAATLSGGMDSSSVVAVANNVLGKPSDFQAFSVIPEKTLDESPWIDEIVRHTGVRHSYLDISNSKLSKTIGQSLRAHDEPYQGSSCLYQYLLREKIAAAGIKVLLVGEGGDEVLGGYRRLLYPYLLSLRAKKRNSEFEKALLDSSEFMEMPAQEIQNNLLRYADIVSKQLDGQENKSAYSLLSEDFTKRHRNILDEPYYSGDASEGRNLFFAQLKRHLFTRDIPYVLRMEDRNSMAFGLEARVPFLDHRFIELVFSYDFAEFMKGGRNKSMLRRAMRGILPNAITERWSKSPRPGNNAHLMYDVLKEEMRERLRDVEIGSMPYWSPSLLENFEKDALIRDEVRAEAWFRVYLLSRWAKEIFREVEMIQ